jgi:hypothetical protein
MSPRLERALRWAAVCHAGQTRKGSDIPYFEHVVAVAMILDRAGFEEDVVIAGLLHDVIEDTEASFDDVATRFGTAVAEIVRACSEVKLDAQGRKQPWIDRKRDHLAVICAAGVPIRAVVLADKLHNLTSIEVDLEERRPTAARGASRRLPRGARPNRWAGGMTAAVFGAGLPGLDRPQRPAIVAATAFSSASPQSPRAMSLPAGPIRKMSSDTGNP